MSNKKIRIMYQSFVDREHGGQYWPHLEKYFLQPGFSELQIDINGITPHDSYAHTISEFRCAREVVCNAVKAEQEGYDAVVVGHFQDAGLYEARTVVDIPVLALGEASMLYCCQLAQRLGIVTINPRFTPWFHHQIRKYGLESRVTGVHAMDFDPGQIIGALGSVEKTKEVKALFIEQARPLIEQGVELILPGGGIPMALFASEDGFRIDGAPVVNGIEIVLKMAQIAVQMQTSSALGVSRVGEYAKAPPEIIEEFITNPKGL
jgi:Asp/Glu/hydantoin racemase